MSDGLEYHRLDLCGYAHATKPAEKKNKNKIKEVFVGLGSLWFRR